MTTGEYRKLPDRFIEKYFLTYSIASTKTLLRFLLFISEFSIIKQKSLKIDVDLEKQEEATRELEHDIQIYLTKLELLNKKMCNARQQHDNEENECQMEHNELVLKLKVSPLKIY